MTRPDQPRAREERSVRSAAAGGQATAQIEVAPLPRGRDRPAARMLAEAFLDDPAWSAGSPRGRGHRRLANRASFRALLAASRRHGAAVRSAGWDGVLKGVAVSFDPGDWPPPNRLEAFDLAWLVIAGPAPALRSYRDEARMRDVHISRPHVYLSAIGVDPAAQGRGVGRALLEDAIGRAEAQGVPVYLETATEHAAAMYRRFGFQHLGEVDLPSGVRLWLLERPPGG